MGKITYSVLRAQILEKYQAYEKHSYKRRYYHWGMQVGRVADQCYQKVIFLPIPSLSHSSHRAITLYMRVYQNAHPKGNDCCFPSQKQTNIKKRLSAVSTKSPKQSSGVMLHHVSSCRVSKFNCLCRVLIKSNMNMCLYIYCYQSANFVHNLKVRFFLIIIPIILSTKKKKWPSSFYLDIYALPLLVLGI